MKIRGKVEIKVLQRRYRNSENTLRHAFAKEGYHRRAARKKPLLSQSQKAKRLELLSLQLYEMSGIGALFFGLMNAISGWERLEIQSMLLAPRRRDCMRTVHFPKKNFFMIWDGILGSTREKLLVIWEKDNWGSITARAYIDHILQPVVVPFYQRQIPHLWSIIFMDDNVPAHRAKITKEFKKNQLIRSLDWPASSPDLNPIENI
jgi:hypothetical protein